MTHEIGPQWEEFCEHKWETVKFIEEGNEWTHYMRCKNCGARRTITHQSKQLTTQQTE